MLNCTPLWWAILYSVAQWRAGVKLCLLWGFCRRDPESWGFRQLEKVVDGVSFGFGLHTIPQGAVFAVWQGAIPCQPLHAWECGQLVDVAPFVVLAAAPYKAAAPVEAYAFDHSGLSEASDPDVGLLARQPGGPSDVFLLGATVAVDVHVQQYRAQDPPGGWMPVFVAVVAQYVVSGVEGFGAALFDDLLRPATDVFGFFGGFGGGVDVAQVVGSGVSMRNQRVVCPGCDEWIAVAFDVFFPAHWLVEQHTKVEFL